MISCLLILRLYCATRLNLFDSLGDVSPYFYKINNKNAIQIKKITYIWYITAMDKIAFEIHVFMNLYASECRYAILAFYYALSSLWRLFQYI